MIAPPAGTVIVMNAEMTMTAETVIVMTDADSVESLWTVGVDVDQREREEAADTRQPIDVRRWCGGGMCVFRMVFCCPKHVRRTLRVVHAHTLRRG